MYARHSRRPAMELDFLKQRESINPCTVPGEKPYRVLNSEQGKIIWDVLRSLWQSFGDDTRPARMNPLTKVFGPILLCLRLLRMMAKDGIANCTPFETHQWQALLLEVKGRYTWVMSQGCVIECLKRYQLPTSIRLTVEFCRQEMKQLRESRQNALAEIPICLAYDLRTLQNVERHWVILRTGIEALHETVYGDMSECSAQVQYVQELIKEHQAQTTRNNVSD